MTAHLDGKHVVFGEVIGGKSLVRRIENEPTQQDKPLRECTIENCGELSDSDYDKVNQKQVDGLGDTYEDYPEDENSEKGLTATEILKIATDLKGFGNAAFKSQDPRLAVEKYQKGLRYIHEDPDVLESDPQDTKSKLIQLKIVLHLNSAQCYVKLENYKSAETAASSALETKGITDAEKGKALYRRALARVGTKDEEEAVKDLEEAAKCVPGDANITNELTRVKKKLAASVQKQKAQMKKFFS